MAFDPDKFLAETSQPQKQAFDPDKFLAETSGQQDSVGGQIQAGVESFGKGATLGYLPQIQAGAETLIEKFTPESDADKQLREQGFDVQNAETSYAEKRDANIERQERQEEQYPKTAMTGEVLGAISTAPLLPQAKGASVIGKIASGAKSGGIYGAIMNPSDTKGEVSGLQIIERFENALGGATTGAVVPLAGQALKGVKKGYKAGAEFLKKGSRHQALSASGAERGTLKKVFKANRIDLEEVGESLFKRRRELLGKAIIMPADDIEKIARKIGTMERLTGSRIGKITRTTDEFLDGLKFEDLTRKQILKVRQSRIDMPTFKKVMKAELRKNLKGVDKRETYRKISKALDELGGEGKNVSLETLRELRKSVDDKLNWTKATQDLTPVQNAFKEIRHKMQDITKRKIRIADEIAGTNNLKAFETANKEFAQYKTLAEFAQNKISAQMGNKLFGMSEMLFGISGATTGGPLGVVLGTAGSMASKKWGGSTGARALRRTAKLLQSDPMKFGKFTDKLIGLVDKKPDVVAKAIIQLNDDPEFREIINPAIKPKQRKKNGRKQRSGN